MRIICSPVLADADSEAIEEGYRARSDEEIASSLQDTIQGMLESATLAKPTKVLAALVAQGIIEFKIATLGDDSTGRHKRLFHDKVGVFRDDNGGDAQSDEVVFKGSMNETWAGLAMDGNLESVDVFVSWGDGREQERVQSEKEYFDKLWENKYDPVTVRDFPELPKNELVSTAEAVEWESLVDEIVEEIKVSKQESPDTGPSPRTPLPHQQDALDTWRDQGRRGVFEHATGSGKTFTALCAIREALKKDETPIIFVPSSDLLTQWRKELKTTNRDLEPKLLVCGDGHTSWREDGLLRSWTRPGSNPRIVLTTMQTAITDDFRALLDTGDHLFVVADEVHRIGSSQHQKILNFDSGPRLGLSATPRRAGDEEGTSAIMRYFEGVVEPPFTLNDAIKAGRLSPYFYHVHKTQLTPDEQEDWEHLTNKIIRKYRQLEASDNADPKSSESLKRLQIRRASIVKEARSKVDLAQQVIDHHYEPGDRWLVYCSELDQLSAVVNALHEKGRTVLEYHSKMSGDRDRTLDYFENDGGIIVSVKCLDEGVDIPNATHALILASSKNPREFIQRRGRVLRKSDNKNFAHVHDAVVLPHDTGVEAPVSNILKGELARAIKFGEDAEGAKSLADLREIAIETGIDLEEMSQSGFESDGVDNE